MAEKKKILPKTYLFDRDEHGQLIPQKVKLVEKVAGEDFYIKVIPMSRGFRKKVMQSGIDDKGDTTYDADVEIVLNCCKEPEFTKEELEDTPIGLIENIALTVFKISNIDIKSDDTKKEALEKKDEETDFQKAS